MSSRDYQPKNVKRHKGITAEVPVIYGNLSWMLGKKDPFHTHKWTAFLRGTRNEDLTFFIKKVVFNLHDTFDKPKRGLLLLLSLLIFLSFSYWLTDSFILV